MRTRTGKACIPILVMGTAVGAVAITRLTTSDRPHTKEPIQRTKRPQIAASSERVNVPLGSAPTRGDANARVTIIEYGDFECPFVAQMEPSLDRLRQELKGHAVRFVWKDRPLPSHKHARLAAAAARAAGEQGRFWEMHDRILRTHKVTPEDLDQHARALGLDLARFHSFLDSNRADRGIDQDIAEAKSFGAGVTPTLFVSGRRVRGALPYERLAALVRAELERVSPADPMSRLASMPAGEP